MVGAAGVRVPHMGWNRLRHQRTSMLLDGIDDGAWAYFVHGYAAPVDAACIAHADHGGPFAAVVQHGHVAGAQFHPGQSATLRLGPKTVLARFGMVHPATLKTFDVDGPIAAVELFLDAIPAKKGAAFARPGFTPPALQAVTRDFAFLVPQGLAAGDLVRSVQGADKANITGVRVFDVFAGQGVPEGKVSIALEVTLQPGEASFKDADLKAIAEKVVAAATKLGGELRG
jgi:phenylalanyl-tRNA synthetase beta chain